MFAPVSCFCSRRRCLRADLFCLRPPWVPSNFTLTTQPSARRRGDKKCCSRRCPLFCSRRRSLFFVRAGVLYSLFATASSPSAHNHLQAKHHGNESEGLRKEQIAWRGRHAERGGGCHAPVGFHFFVRAGVLAERHQHSAGVSPCAPSSLSHLQPSPRRDAEGIHKKTPSWLKVFRFNLRLINQN